MPASFPGADGRGRDPHGCGCGLGGDDPLKILPGHARRHGLTTVVVATHMTALVEAADHVVRMGPGVGPDGGRVVSSGPPSA